MSDCPHNAPNHGPNMGDVQTQWQQSDQPNSEELLDRLADCLYSFEGEVDIASIDRCLEELEQAGVPGEDFDVERSLQEFHERYAPAFETRASENKKKGSRVRRPLARIAIIAAALCAFMVTAQASGFDIFGAIARWTSEQFAFVKVDEIKDTHEDGMYRSLQDALSDWKVAEKLAPTKFPEGAVLSDIMVRQEKENVAFSAKYALGKGVFRVSIVKIGNESYSEIEINDPNVERYWRGEIEHHIMTDVNQVKAVWYNGPWECNISGAISKEELLLMIDSIYE